MPVIWIRPWWIADLSMKLFVANLLNAVHGHRLLRNCFELYLGCRFVLGLLLYSSQCVLPPVQMDSKDTSFTPSHVCFSTLLSLYAKFPSSLPIRFGTLLASVLLPVFSPEIVFSGVKQAANWLQVLLVGLLWSTGSVCRLAASVKIHSCLRCCLVPDFTDFSPATHSWNRVLCWRSPVKDFRNF